MHKNIIDCCTNCKYCLKFPRKNRYGDIDYMCAINGYCLRSINEDISRLFFRKIWKQYKFLMIMLLTLQ